MSARRCTDAQRAALVRAREARSERDDAVTCNLAPDELALWRKVRSQFLGSPHARLEAFREYTAAHPGELVAALPDVDAFPFGANAPPPAKNHRGGPSRTLGDSPQRPARKHASPDATIVGMVVPPLGLDEAGRTLVLHLVRANRLAVASGERPVHVSAVVSSCGLASREAVIAYLRTLDLAA